MLESHSLQMIIGTDKRNPYFSICRGNGQLFIFYGACLLETVPDDMKKPQTKLAIAKLFNAKMKQTALTKEFGVARATMKRWGDALQSGDLERLYDALSGPGPKKKLTMEVKAFARFRFQVIYKEDIYRYSQIIREEIKEVFGVSLSAETLRPHFNTWKKEFYSPEDVASPSEKPENSPSKTPAEASKTLGEAAQKKMLRSNKS